MQHTYPVYILLGSNLGNRQRYLDEAISGIEKNIAPLEQRSSVYQTASWGNTDQPEYLNQVVLFKSDIPAPDLLHRLLEIERKLGRERNEKWGARTIDIDMLFYGEEVIRIPGLSVPHPHLHERRFVLAPLAEIAPEWIHPVFKQSIKQILGNLKDNLLVQKITP